MPFPPATGTFEIDFGGMDLIRSRDCHVFFKAETYTVVPDAAMLEAGWPGGQGVQWVDSTRDEFTVTFSSGLFGGFLIWGSDESADQHVATTRNQIVYPHAVMGAGNALISTSSYEKYTLASRLAGPPFVPLVYAPHDPVYFSLRGLWTKEDELTITADPRAPAFFCGFVMQVPKDNNQSFLGIQTSL